MRKKILIIEEEPGISHLLKMQLEKNFFSAEVKRNGSSGLMKALNIDYDLIILSVLLPGMDGFQVLKKIRQLKATPVIMLSTQDDKNALNFLLKAGANDYAVKPFSCMGIVEKAKQLLQ